MRPDQWGEILFAGSDARVELLAADNKPAKSFTPGKPLTIRVTDADVSLDLANRDKLSVTLRSRSGDVKTVALKETKVNSGIFVGTVTDAQCPAPECAPGECVRRDRRREYSGGIRRPAAVQW